VIWVAVGGRGTLIAAALGAASQLRKTVFTSGSAGAVLAVHAGRIVHSCDAAAAEGIIGTFQCLVEPWKAATHNDNCRERCATKMASSTEHGGVSG